MNIIKLSAIGSTNDYLKALRAETDLEDGTVVWAKDQIQGRGQMGSNWHFNVGKSLAFSVFKRLGSISVEHQYSITIQVSLTLLKYLEQFGIPNLSVKWPNDIMAGDKKLCGILIENQLQGDLVKSSVVGIGLNVNNDAFQNLPKATSMFLALGNSFDIEGLLKTLSEEVIHGLDHFYAEGSLLIEMYEKSLYRKDQVSVFSTKEKSFNGIIRGINTSGELKVETDDEVIKAFRLKEIKLLN